MQGPFFELVAHQRQHGRDTVGTRARARHEQSVEHIALGRRDHGRRQVLETQRRQVAQDRGRDVIHDRLAVRGVRSASCLYAVA